MDIFSEGLMALIRHQKNKLLEAGIEPTVFLISPAAMGSLEREFVKIVPLLEVGDTEGIGQGFCECRCYGLRPVVVNSLLREPVEVR